MTDPKPLSEYFANCLWFAAGTLSRAVGKLADDCFAGTGLSPSHAFLMMLVNERPGLTQKELAQALHLAPSTVTRFVDSLVAKGYVAREAEGKLSRVSPTEKGKALAEPIAAAWKKLYHRYSDLLGEQAGRELTTTVAKAGATLERE